MTDGEKGLGVQSSLDAQSPSLDAKSPSLNTKSSSDVNSPSIDGPDLPPTLATIDERAVWRKVDRRLLPMLGAMYLMSFLDRGNAKLEGLLTQLDLTGNKYNIALVRPLFPAVFTVSWLPGITILWGIIMTLMGLVKTYPQLVGARVALGVVEAGLFPGIIYFLTLWYPRFRLQYRIGLFFGACSVAGAFSGLLAWAIGFMGARDGGRGLGGLEGGGVGGLEGWSWIFILEGLATVLVGVVALFVLVDYPETATFLTPEERAFVLHRKQYDLSTRGGGEARAFAPRYVWAAFRDWQVWVHTLILMSVIGPLYGITLFLPFGYDTAISQLLTVPPYVCATLTVFAFGHYSDRLRARAPFVLAGLVMALVGYAINIAPAATTGAKYFGTFLCVMGTYGAYPTALAWCVVGNNLAGEYKRAVGMAFAIGIGNFAGAISSNVYRQQDAPRYVLGHGIELMFLGIGLVAVPLTALAYWRINARRDALEGSVEEGAIEEGGIEKGEKGGIELEDEKRVEMGDRAADFRYTL
ncbi:hypothetical protein PLICRDRAFT_116666 [Plicaturopsis crispa FD-325 SS-3]|uniref:MFS general substrate transporter n=1 Tax=Plicaturopsis crispa FD-325 SS-3 TaxID=944288 RepID=A0A0C9TAH6_PLICR|nr:hypothetical protein PLICRDRAFT_116666 [Plicaturopsis crispa FD-325 SS-3]